MPTSRDRYLTKFYEIDEQDYQRLLVAGDSRCWICKTKPRTRRLHVDHSHRLGNKRIAVRGILDSRCNRGLVWFKDSPALLRAAADYLESNRAQEILAGDSTTSLSTL